MLHSDLEVLHTVRGRIRVRLPEGLSDPGAAGFFLCGQKEVNGFRYNPVIRTALVWYEGISQDEILARLAVAYANQNGMKYIHLKNCQAKKTPNITPSGRIALATILANITVQVFMPATILANITKWCAVGTTAGAVIEHGYHELCEQGAFDPEVMSIMYLANAVNKGQTIYATPLVWLITFGRHLFRPSDRGVMLKIEEGCENEYYVRVVRDTKNPKKTAFLGEFFNRYLQTYPQMPLASGGRFIVQE